MAKATKAPEAIEAIEAIESTEVKAPEHTIGGKEIFQEWKAEIKTDKETGAKSFEKLKLIREVVKITPEQAELLNDGLLYGGNSIVNAYFRPE